MRTDRGYKVPAGESRNGERWKMKGVTLNMLDLKVGASDNEGQLAVFEQTGYTPMGGPPLHIHPYQDEMFIVHEGNYLFQCGDEKFELTAGDTIFLPRGLPHAFIQLTEKGRLTVIYQPAGKMEAFFKKTNEWTAPPTQEEVMRVFAESDMQVVGPPLQS
ncbi:MAG: cupin domain-containing protein [Flavisolibacter sp.]